ncbi:MAG: MFS transporter [Planctomycetes bacterium]|nr:MFS transporter [Planctomycetota bacterium]
MAKLDRKSEVLPALSVRGPELRTSLRIVTVGWMFGSVWMTAVGGSTMLNLGYLAGFTELHWGLLSATMFASTLAQLPASWLIERTGLRKGQFMRSVTVSRAMWILVGLAPMALLLFGPSALLRTLVAWGVLTIIFFSRILDHMGAPAWINWMADLIPPRLRARLFARRAVYSLICQAAATVAVGLLLDAVVGRETRVQLKALEVSASQVPALVWALLGIFTLAGIMGITDIRLFGRVREIVRRQPVSPIGLWEVLREPMGDRQFRRFSGGFAVEAFGTALSLPFYALAAQQHLHLDNLQTMLILAVFPPIGSLLSSGPWGRAIDRWGRRPILVLGMLGVALVPVGWVFLPPRSLLLAGLVNVYSGAVWQGLGMARLNTELIFADAKGRSTYTAALNVIIALTGTLGGIVGGILAGAVKGWTATWGPLAFGHYHVMFGLCSIVRLVGVAPLLRMEDPQAKPVAFVARQMAVSVLFTAPVNLLRPIIRLRLPGGWLRRSPAAPVTRTVECRPTEEQPWAPKSKPSTDLTTPKGCGTD